MFVDWRSLDDSSCPQIVWLGHATFLLVWKNQRILIDPNFSQFIGIIPRRCPLPVRWRELRPDSIFLSHAHMDHLDKRTLTAYSKASLYIPEGSGRFLNRDLRKSHVPLAANFQFNIGEIQVTSVPARHGGWRYPWQKGCQAFGYVFSDGKDTVYYAGDTAYGSHFSDIAKSFHITTALLPIGAYAPRWFLKSRHLNPEEAITAYKDLAATSMIPYHFGAYRLSLEPLDAPFPRFAECASKHSCEWRLPIGI